MTDMQAPDSIGITIHPRGEVRIDATLGLTPYALITVAVSGGATEIEIEAGGGVRDVDELAALIHFLADNLELPDPEPVAKEDQS